MYSLQHSAREIINKRPGACQGELEVVEINRFRLESRRSVEFSQQNGLLFHQLSDLSKLFAIAN